MGRPTQVHVYLLLRNYLDCESSVITSGRKGNTRENQPKPRDVSQMPFLCLKLAAFIKLVQHVTACSVFGLASKCLFSYLLLLGSIPYLAPSCTSWFELSWALTWCLSRPFKMPRLLPINDQRQNQRAFVSKEYETTMHQRKLQRRLSFLIYWFLVCWHGIIAMIPCQVT